MNNKNIIILIMAILFANSVYLSANENKDYKIECELPTQPYNPYPDDASDDVLIDFILRWNINTTIKSNFFSKAISNKIIYGNDDRLEEYEVKNINMLQAADATVAIVLKEQLYKNSDGSYHLSAGTYGFSNNLCNEEPYRNQPDPAMCTGFLVFNDIIATAGHCIKNDTSSEWEPEKCSKVAFVFGFYMEDEENARLDFDSSEIYYCKEVVARELSDSGPDWSLVRLDREVTNHIPCSVRSSGKISDNESLFVIGHPSGIPRKYAGGANVKINTNSYSFDANLDTYSGNSGSPVFNANTYMVEGILVEGGVDFIRDPYKNCYISNTCSDSGCSGSTSFETVTRATEFSNYLPNYSVYFGTASNNLSLKCSNILDSYCDPGELIPKIKYYWQVTAKNSCGEIKGPIWSFIAPFGDHQVTFNSTPSEGGNIIPVEGAHLYETGKKVYLYASPAKGYRFDYWDGNTAENKSPETYFIVTSSERITAYFVLLPEAVNDLVYTSKNSKIKIDVCSNDINHGSQNLTIINFSKPEHGEISISENNLIYYPLKDFTGTETINYTISDEAGGVDSAILEIIVASDFSLSLDGINEYVDCGKSQLLNIRGPLTIEAWIKPIGWGESTNVGFGRIVDKENYIVFINNTGHKTYKDHSLVFYLYFPNDMTTIVNTTQDSISLNKWQHIAAIYDGVGQIKIYINGIEQNYNQLYYSPSGPIADSSDYSLLIGEAPTFDRAFKGYIDEVRIFNIVRSNSDINKTLFRRLTGSETGLAGYYPFRNLKYPFYDMSCNNNNGISNGGLLSFGIPNQLPPNSFDLGDIIKLLKIIANMDIELDPCEYIDGFSSPKADLSQIILLLKQNILKER